MISQKVRHCLTYNSLSSAGEGRGEVIARRVFLNGKLKMES